MDGYVKMDNRTYNIDYNRFEPKQNVKKEK